MPDPKTLKEGLEKLADLTLNQSDAQKGLFAGEVYKKRYRNFFTLPLYWAVIGFFIWLGMRYKGSFSPPAWYILMGLSGFFLLLSFFVWLSYGHLIIKGLKKRPPETGSRP